jgi:esterase/lipase
MVVHSDKDHIFPQEYVESIYRRLGCEKEFFLLADREHLIMTNNVDEVAPGVSSWLRKIMDTPD